MLELSGPLLFELSKTHTHTRCSCITNSAQEDPSDINHQTSLYIGGLNLFNLPANTTALQSSAVFIGAIRNVIVGNTQLNLSCPLSEENTVKGMYLPAAAAADIVEESLQNEM